MRQFQAMTILCTSLLAGCIPADPKVDPAPAVVLTSAEVKVVQDTLRKDMKDPTSAMFGSMVAGRLSSGGVAVCGLVNAKNGFGGYTGAEPFSGTLTAASGGPSFDAFGIANDKETAGLVFTECYKHNLVPKDVPLGAAPAKNAGR